MTRTLLILAILAQTVDVSKCGTDKVRVKLPPTAQCPEGWVVGTVDTSVKPPAITYECENPAPVPSPSSSPVPPSPPPSSSPSTPPTPVPSPSPIPSPSTPPPPSPQPSPSATPVTGCSTCPAPYDIRIGINKDAAKRQPGWRNTGGITPDVVGDCAHKGNPSCDARCAASESCADHVGSPYWNRYGQPQAYQSGNGFTKHPIERTTDSCNRNDPMQVPCGYNLAFATNHEPDWENGRFKFAGPMEVCASLPHLNYWSCRRGTMTDDGRMTGFDQPIYQVMKTPEELRGVGIPRAVQETPAGVRRGRSRSVYSSYPDLK